jgi:hypothetical protein
MAAAWVKFRRREVVEKFDGHSLESWVAYNVYDSMWEYKPLEASLTLHSALISGNLKASGHRNVAGATMETIPALEWETLTLSVPSAYRGLPSSRKDEPWLNIRVEGSDVQKLWRAPSDTEGRTRYDWATVTKIYETVLMEKSGCAKSEDSDTRYI